SRMQLQLCDVRSRCASLPYSTDAHAAPNLGQIEKINDTFDAVGLGFQERQEIPLDVLTYRCRVPMPSSLSPTIRPPSMRTARHPRSTSRRIRFQARHLVTTNYRTPSMRSCQSSPTSTTPSR